MPNVITLKLDVTKLDKARFFRGKPDKTGHEPVWADIVLIPRRELGRYGDTHVVKQSKKKDEEADLPIIGNATERSAQAAPPPPPRASAPASNGPDEDVPF